MRRFYIFESLKIFVLSQPPAIVFLLCLFSFIIVLSSFTGYIDDHNIDNPDEIDWNIFRERLASLEFCVKYPEKMPIEKMILMNKKNDKLIDDDISIQTYQYDLTLNMNYNGNLSALFDLDILSGSIDGFLIGLEKGKLDIKINIDSISANENECKNTPKIQCSNFVIDGCVTLESSLQIFPKTKAPKICSIRKYARKNKKTNHLTTLTAYKETPDLTTQYWCPASFGAKSTIKNKKDPSLNALLTKADKTIICKNLEFIIIILSLLFTILIVYGTIRAARKKSLYYTQVLDM